MKFLANGFVFLITYLIFVVPTYLLPYMGSNSSILLGAAADGEIGLSPATLLHLGCLMMLIVMTWFRGSFTQQMWIITFPILAALFDFMPGLSLIPFAPTLLHLLALSFGVSVSKEEPQPESESI